MTFPPEVWNGVLRRLQGRVPAFSYATWLEKLVARGGQDGVELLCPTPFHRDRVRDHFLVLICECFEEELGSKVPVRATLAAPDGECRSGDIPSGEGPSSECPSSESLSGERPSGEDPSHESAAATDTPSRPVEQPRERGPRSRSSAPGSRRHGAIRGENTRSGRFAAGASRRNDTADIGSVIDSALGAVASGRPAPINTPRKGGGIPHGSTTPGAAPMPGGHSSNRPLDRKQTPSTPARAAQSLASPTRPGQQQGGMFSPAQARAAQGVSSPPQQRCFPLNFDSFVVGPCNALAREASLAIAREQQLSLNRLYLTSAPGLGKTHLAKAVVLEARRLGNERARYTTAEAFTNEFLAAVRSGEMARFKQRYRRDCNVLVVEDVQFLQGKKSTQLEFFHTVQHILDAGGRVLLTGEERPQDLEHLDPRVRGQIAGGFVAELEVPDAAVRRNILRAKAAHGGVRLPDDCLDLLVESVRGNVRELESVLIQLVTTASLLNKSIDAGLTREALSKKASGRGSQAPRPEPETIIKVVAGFFKTSPAIMSTRSRRRDILVPRQLAMYLCHRYTDASLAEIGRALGRDHPAVKNAVQRIEREVLERAPLRYKVQALVERLDELGYTAAALDPE